MSLLRTSTRLASSLASARTAPLAAARAFSASSSSRSNNTSITNPSEQRNLPAEQKSRQELAHQAEIVSDAPHELTQRSVRIFKPAKTANSSGKAGTATWRVDWDILQGSARWENPLMGWASSADYMQGTSLKFKSKEDAVHFCEKQGWDYFVQEPKAPRIGPKSYAANYDYNPKKLRIHHTK